MIFAKNARFFTVFDVSTQPKVAIFRAGEGPADIHDASLALPVQMRT
jgi:hypothetical protein